ncbi:adhesion G-protein coupled receptor D1-like [Saccoglossus kowalevskii]|uniref:Probable G-protein coupled receptor 133-like n=1 Tax=Saccoglossus kowalevskii TaxID=10224 RepID=A0ABM0M919_SACKO|nr:PREDICTED: probable G-protein coupled receptor 133-like [Saccoglossus kowalevskii]
MTVSKVYDNINVEHLPYYFHAVCPAIFVGVSAAARPQGYGTELYCWLSSEHNLTWAFLGPVLGIIVINIYLLARVMLEIISVQSKNVDKSNKLTNLKNNAKATAILLPILGLTWIFGIFALNDELVVFQYLFTIFNAFQGLFIFIFHCALNSEVRNALRRKQRNWALTKSSFGTPSVGISPDCTKERSTTDSRARYNSTTITGRPTTMTSVTVSVKHCAGLVVTNLEESQEACSNADTMPLAVTPSKSRHPTIIENEASSSSYSNPVEAVAVVRPESGVSSTSSNATKMTEVTD